MVPGHVQGLSRVPPDHPEGGAGGELYSEGLWTIRNFEPRTLKGRAKPHPGASAGRPGEPWARQSTIWPQPCYNDNCWLGQPSP